MSINQLVNQDTTNAYGFLNLRDERDRRIRRLIIGVSWDEYQVIRGEIRGIEVCMSQMQGQQGGNDGAR